MFRGERGAGIFQVLQESRTILRRERQDVDHPFLRLALGTKVREEFADLPARHLVAFLLRAEELRFKLRERTLDIADRRIGRSFQVGIDSKCELLQFFQCRIHIGLYSLELGSGGFLIAGMNQDILQGVEILNQQRVDVDTGGKLRTMNSMRNAVWMTPLILVAMLMASSLGGCYRSMDVQENAVVATGRQAAVLSLHQRKPLSNGCQYGLTLTNNLTVEIRDLTLHFTAYGGTDDRLQTVTRQFFGVKPTRQQFAEISFAFPCYQVKRIEVGDFGRCMVGELGLRSSEPGRCLDLVDIPRSRFVELVKSSDM